MSRFKTDVISLLVNNDQSGTFEAHNTGQIYNQTEHTETAWGNALDIILNCKESLPKQLFLK